MIKKVLFITSLFVAGFASAQTFNFLDANDVDITNTTHYEYGDANTLSQVKFHVENLTGVERYFAVRVEAIYTPYSNSDLAVCFGVACYSADAVVSGVQLITPLSTPLIAAFDTVDANSIYTELKISPITWMWNSPATDSAVWRVTLFDRDNPTDSASALVIYSDNSAVSIGEVNSKNVKLTAYPNPVKDNLTINYAIEESFYNAKIDVYDVLGQKITSHVLNSNKGQVNLNVDNLKAGIYFYSIMVDQKTLRTERVIVK